MICYLVDDLFLVDEVETEQKRIKFKGDISDLEKQFADLKEQ